MYSIFYEGSFELEQLNPFLVNHIEIMNSYNKGLVVVDVFIQRVYINGTGMALLGTEKGEEMAKAFIGFLEERIRLGTLCQKDESQKETSQKEVFTCPDGQHIGYSFREIKEKTKVKYILCNIEIAQEHLVKKLERHRDEEILDSIVGASEAIVQLKGMVKKAAKSDSTILIVGETGTGKEMFAKTIHRLSDRGSHPFVAINCGAIPDSLIESELFGYDKGSFTGADSKGKIGKFEYAHRGTVFLDEIENMSILLQMKLLRVLEERSFLRVGGLEEIPIDIRVLAATNTDLKSMVDRGAFRRDLYYRLNIIKLEVPKLSDREDDVLLLSQHFIKMFAIKMKKNVAGLSDEVVKLFLNQRWEGNVRELRNIIEYAMNFEETQFIGKDSLPDHFFLKASDTGKVPSFRTLAEIERDEIERALNYFGWDDKGKVQVAKVLNISRSSIYRKVLKMTEKTNDEKN